MYSRQREFSHLTSYSQPKSTIVNPTFIRHSDKYADILKRALESGQNRSFNHNNKPLTETTFLDHKKSMPPPPAVISGKSLGLGAYSNVYLVCEEKTKTLYAQKIVPKSVIAKHKESLQQQIRIHLRLKHQNIISLYHVYMEDQKLKFLMEFAQQTLFTYLKEKGGRLPERQALLIIKQILQGIKYLHSQGIAHRDLKLQNVLLAFSLDNKIREGDVKICDFGCAKRKKQFDSKELVGTIDYLSPEVASCASYTHKTDIWAVGVLLYQLIYGSTFMANIRESEKYSYLMKLRPEQDLQYPSASVELRQLFGKMLVPEHKRQEAEVLLADKIFTELRAE